MQAIVYTIYMPKKYKMIRITEASYVKLKALSIKRGKTLLALIADLIK